MSKSLIFESEPEFTTSVFNKDVESFMCVATIKAPQIETDESQKRAGIDIVAVLDRSGSMEGEKISMLHQTVNLMIDHLKECDRLSLVAYDSRVDIVLPLTRMTNEGKAIAKKSLIGITPRGGTNLSGGLLRGFDIIEERGVDRNDVASILLMTDGLANEGIRGSDQLVLATSNRIKEIPFPTTLYTFGFGTDHDGKLLTRMAEASGTGTYYFMQSVDSIPQAFADCLGGLLSVHAQSITVTITNGNGDNDNNNNNNNNNSKIKINSITTSFTKTSIEEGKKYSVYIGDIFSEEQRDILIDVSFPSIKNPIEQYELLEIQVKYFNIIEAKTETIKGSIVIQRTAIESQKTSSSMVTVASAKVDEQRNRVKTAKVMEEAQKLGDLGQLEQARNLLENCKVSIVQSRSAKTQTSAGLVADLDSCVTKMKSKADYDGFGSKNLSSHARQHWVQRGAACEMIDSDESQSFGFYETKAKLEAKKTWFSKVSK